MDFNIITIFPEILKPYANSSILGRAQEHNLININFIDPRDFTTDKHRTIDDTPYGGGPGMVMKVEPIDKAVESITKKQKNKKTRTILLSTRGKIFTSKEAKRLSKYDNIILIAGRYEGVDERVAKHVADEEVSVGDYVLAGGELPAMTITEAIARQIPGVLGKEESLEEIKGSYPVYTKPEDYKGKKVPKVLLSGNHKKIEEWRNR